MTATEIGNGNGTEIETGSETDDAHAPHATAMSGIETGRETAIVIVIESESESEIETENGRENGTGRETATARGGTERHGKRTRPPMGTLTEREPRLPRPKRPCAPRRLEARPRQPPPCLHPAPLARLCPLHGSPRRSLLRRRSGERRRND
jgi:hypothetical protein